MPQSQGVDDPSVTMSIHDDETVDVIRGISLVQKKKGYRFSVDSLLLADFTDLDGVKSVLDIGTGCGIIPLLLAQRSHLIHVTGIEIQEGLSHLARRNILAANLSDRISVVMGDILSPNEKEWHGQFDLIVSNPPYNKAGAGRTGEYAERNLARHEITMTMPGLIAVSVHHLREDGRAAFIYPSRRYQDILAAMEGHLGIKRIRRILTKEEELILVEAQKNYKDDPVEEPPLDILFLNSLC